MTVDQLAEVVHPWHGVATPDQDSVSLEVEDPYRLRGWSPIAKLAACNRVRSVIDEESGLLAVSEAAAETICSIMAAKTASVILIDERGYRDLVNVGDVAPGDPRFPDDTRYPISSYPAASKRLLARAGYVSSDTDQDVLAEYRELWPDEAVGSVLGVPIISDGAVFGEMFMLRDKQAPSFTVEDMRVVVQLAAQFGPRLPSLLAEYEQGTTVDFED